MTGPAERGGAEAFSVDHAPVTGLGTVCREILDTVPSWFGIPEANDAYVDFVDTHDTWIAYSAQRAPIGLISGQLHCPRQPRSRSWRSARNGIAGESVARSSIEA